LLCFSDIFNSIIVIQRFTEKQAKVLRDVQKKLEANPNNKTQPIPVLKARMLYKSCLDKSTTDKLQFDPLFRFLKEHNLPKVPTIITNVEASDGEFDWIKSIVKIKRSLGSDKLIGFEICKFIS
jgi:hypothetical protein